MVKVFTENSNGKIEFTKDELERLLNEVWRDGYSSNRSYWWTSPTFTTTPLTNTKEYTISCNTETEISK